MGRVGWSVVLILGVSFVALAQAQKGSSKGTQTDSDLFSRVKTSLLGIMDATDWVRSGALVVAFLATNFAGRDTWILADFISTLAFGVAFYFFPEAIVGYQVTITNVVHYMGTHDPVFGLGGVQCFATYTEGKLDAVHLLLAQGFGALLLGISVTAYASRGSADRSVSGSIFMSRILAGTVLLQSMIIDHMKAKSDKQRWSSSHMTFGMLGCGLWVVGNLWQYLRGPSYGSGGFNLKERLTKHLLIDLFVLFGLGVVNFAYPDFALSFITMKGFTPDGIHAHLVRSNGALILMTCLHAHSAMGFSDNIDKRAHLVGRFVMYVLVIPMVCLYQYKYVFLSQKMFLIELAFIAVPFFNSACAYFIRGKDKRS